MRQALLATAAALALGACNPDAMREVGIRNQMLFDRQDPRSCPEQPGGCPPPVAGHIQQIVAECALETARARWAEPVPSLPATTYSFEAALRAIGVRQRSRNGSQRAAAPDPADEDRATARLTALFGAAVDPCTARAPRR